MKRLGLICVALCLLTACSSLPKLVTDPTVSGTAPGATCRAAFPQGDWQLQHAISATVKGRKMGRLIGALVLSARERTIQCALMTIEGLVLFSAQYDGQLVVERAVAPFDRPGFAQGLMDDLMLMFLQPNSNGRLGKSAQGKRICRHRFPEGFVTDVVMGGPNGWMINKYNDQGKLLRTVTAVGNNQTQPADRAGIAQHMTMENRSGGDYRLELKLIEAIPLKRASE